MRDVATIIVSFNCREVLRECLRSLPAGSEVVVVDNAAADGTAEMVRTEFPSILLIANNTNRGFAAACNQGIEASDGEFVLLLNPDAFLDSRALETLLRVMRTYPTVGACGPRILNTDGTLQLSCRAFPTLWLLVCDELRLSALFGSRGWFRGYRMSAGPLDKTREVDQLMGSCLLLRRPTLEQVGPLDERFFVYFEEVDLCRRLKDVGWGVLFVHDAVITHIGGQSSKTDSRASLHYRYASLFAYFQKYSPGWRVTALRSVVQIGAVLRWLAGQREYGTIACEVWRLAR